MSNMDIGKIIKSFIDLKLHDNKVVVPMLWGPPGIGKSDGMKEYKETLKKITGKEVMLHDVRLTLYGAVDLKGLPVPDKDHKESVWLTPEIFKMDEDENVINILFLDEFSSATPQVQVASYQLMLDRQIGNHKLPDNCIIVAAGNRMSDKGVTYKMPSPLANRLFHIDVEFDFNRWRDWAFDNKVADEVIGFLSARGDVINTFEDNKGSENAFATPRSWKKVSDVINTGAFEVFDEDTKYMYVKGLVGNVANEFISYSKIVEEAPKYEDIRKGKAKEFSLDKVENKVDVEQFIYSMIVSNIKEESEENKEEIDNVLDFVTNKMGSREMVTTAYISMIGHAKHLKNRFLNNGSFRKWAEDNQSLVKMLKEVA